MEKKDVSHLLDQIAAFLELKGENAFRIRAYHTAARSVAHFPGDLRQAVTNGELAEVPGIGPGTLKIIEEAMSTGRAQVLETLRGEIPPGLVEMMKISGLGVSKIRQIHESLGITTTAELEEVARDGRLARLPRFGKKTAEKIIRGLKFLQQVNEFKLFHHAQAEAARIARSLGELPGIAAAEIVGSVRRRRELIRDLDFVVQVDGPPTVLADRLAGLGGVTEFVGNAPGVFTLRFGSDISADVYGSTTENHGFELLRATGSAGHIEALIGRAEGMGFEWTTSGLVRDGHAVPCPTEEEVYRLLGMAYVPPELREGGDEIRGAIDGTLPALVEPDDMKGFLHCHSDYSDGTSTVRDWAEAGLAGGYEYVGITDHSAAATFAGGLFQDSVGRQHADIDAVNRAFPDITVLKGVEVDILETGELDYDEPTRASFDFVIASVHNQFGQTSEQMTSRILRAMDDPHMAILGHPTGRLLLSRRPYPLDLEPIFAKAATRGIAIEINADPQRLDLDWRMVRRATECGAFISIGADAHSTGGMSNMDLGVGIARKGWLTAERVLNSMPLEEFLEFVNRRRKRP